MSEEHHADESSHPGLDEAHDHGHSTGRPHAHGDHGHSHGLVDPSIVRSRAALRAVAASLAVLAGTALIQVAIFVVSGSVALLADLIHNFGDALTAVPLGIAFFLRSRHAERLAGYAVIGAVLASAAVALAESINRLVNPGVLHHAPVLALAGLVGFAGNEWAARIRVNAGRRLSSAALIADGHHARIDGFVSIGVVASAIAIGAGAPLIDPIVGLVITVMILKITLDSWKTIRAAH